MSVRRLNLRVALLVLLALRPVSVDFVDTVLTVGNQLAVIGTPAQPHDLERGAS
jgi:hypothetical protein